MAELLRRLLRTRHGHWSWRRLSVGGWFAPWPFWREWGLGLTFCNGPWWLNVCCSLGFFGGALGIERQEEAPRG